MVLYFSWFFALQVVQVLLLQKKNHTILKKIPMKSLGTGLKILLAARTIEMPIIHTGLGEMYPNQEKRMLKVTYTFLFFIPFLTAGCIEPLSKKIETPQECSHEKAWYRPKDSVGGTQDRNRTEIRAPILPPCRF